ncbi:hypothetical protein DKT69_11890 [Micromonospora sicca]|uniref:PepSY domain-containing protein n=2 Tax=Micromonospora TaxID=1873 RepID=A0A317DQV3_9ACTN|nr:PepSY domain-containing protein [Micromonospora sp. 4G51]MBM0226645.1 PepSY domain-containing protein [Micromonospora sp. ATA51]PWR15275.1 hypothetical protein DKT69_11890 [Micromonospora sp. 4G51]
MRRTSLVLAAAGGAAVLAVTGAALGVTTAEREAPGAALAAATVGPTTDDNPAPDDDSTGRATPTSTASAGAADGTVSREQAGQIALARAGGGRIVEIEAEREHARPVWSVKIGKGGILLEVKVDRANGAVVEIERKRADDHSGDGTRTRTDDRTDDHGGDRAGSDD